ncbi:MAG TPA: hypothetical protein VGI06_04270 [Acidimicrobiales bacterium]
MIRTAYRSKTMGWSMVDGVDGVGTVTCVWCDERTAAGTACAACGGDPAGPFVAASNGMSAVRERRAQARKAMLADRTPPAAGAGADPAAPTDDGLPPEWLPGLPSPEAPPDALAEVAVWPPPAHVWEAPADAQPPWVTGPARSSSVPIIAAVVVPLLVLALIGIGLSTTGKRRRSSVAPPSAPSVTAAPTPASPGASTPPTITGGQPWAAFQGPNFNASFPVRPLFTTQAFNCGCGAALTIRIWRADEGTTSYYLAEMPLPPGTAGFPEDIVNSAVSDMMDSNLTFTASPLSHIGPYTTRDVQVTAETFSGSARIMVGQGTMWMLVGENSYGQPPDWAYFLNTFAPNGQPAPTSTPTTIGGGGYE